MNNLMLVSQPCRILMFCLFSYLRAPSKPSISMPPRILIIVWSALLWSPKSSPFVSRLCELVNAQSSETVSWHSLVLTCIAISIATAPIVESETAVSGHPRLALIALMVSPLYNRDSELLLYEAFDSRKTVANAIVETKSVESCSVHGNQTSVTKVTQLSWGRMLLITRRA